MLHDVGPLVPLTAEIVRRHAPERHGALESLAPFFKALADRLAFTLQALGTAPVKATVTSQLSRDIRSDDAALTPFIITSGRGSLCLWLETDRAFDHLLCELMFGGTGAMAPDDEPDRPASKLETRLRERVCAMLVDGLADELNVQFSLAAARTEVDRTARNSRVGAQTCLQVDVLVNAFSLAPELHILFAKPDLAHLAKALEPVSALPPRRAREAMDDCRFPLTAFLPDVELPLETILALEPGAVLPLGIAPTDPLRVTCEGEMVFTGLLRVQDQTMMVQLSDPAEDEPHAAEAHQQEEAA